jgi:hypothetical protein
VAGPFKFESKPYIIALEPPTIRKAGRKLVARWKLDETEGSNASDSSGNNLDGTLIGNPQWQPSGGKFGGALKLDGVDDYVETDYATDLPVWTVAVWVNSPAVPSSEVPSGPVHRDKNYHINWNHSFDDFRGTAGVQVADTWYAASFGDLQANNWYHLAATYDGEDFKAYKDGILITNNSTPSGDPDSESTTLKLGRHSLYGDHFAGTIDDVRIYDYALSQADIAKIFAGKELGKGVNWIPVFVIVVIAAVAAGLAIYRKKATT